MVLEAVALAPCDVADQDVPVLRRHADEAGVQAVRSARIGNGIEPENLGEGGEEAVLRETERDDENVAGLIHLGDRHADAAPAQVDRLVDERTLRLIRLRLDADRQRDGDAVVCAALSAGRRLTRVVRSHHG